MPHTKGRWKNRYGTIYADNAHETLICEVFDENEDSASNAALIVAAPDLLESLRTAILELDSGKEVECLPFAWVGIARAALAKAGL